MARLTNRVGSPGTNRMQAALYYARQRRLARLAAPGDPPPPPTPPLIAASFNVDGTFYTRVYDLSEATWEQVWSVNGSTFYGEKVYFDHGAVVSVRNNATVRRYSAADGTEDLSLSPTTAWGRASAMSGRTLYVVHMADWQTVPVYVTAIDLEAGSITKRVELDAAAMPGVHAAIWNGLLVLREGNDVVGYDVDGTAANGTAEGTVLASLGSTVAFVQEQGGNLFFGPADARSVTYLDAQGDPGSTHSASNGFSTSIYSVAVVGTTLYGGGLDAQEVYNLGTLGTNTSGERPRLVTSGANARYLALVDDTHLIAGSASGATLSIIDLAEWEEGATLGGSTWCYWVAANS